MTNWKIIDDYYANIWWETKEEKVAPKLAKLAPKKKVLVKKSPDEEIKEEKKIEPIKEEAPKKKLKIVQKIEVVEKEERKPVLRTNEKDENVEEERKFTIKWDTTRKGPVIEMKPLSSKPNQKPDFKKPDFKPSFWENKPSKFSGFKGKKDKKDSPKEEDTRKSKFNKDFKKSRWHFKYNGDEEDLVFTRSNKLQKHKKEEKAVEDIKQNLIERKWETIVIPSFLSIKELSEKIWVVLPKLIAEFMKNWMMVNLNSKIDFETASIIAESFDIKLERDNGEWASVEDIILGDISSFLVEDDLNKLIPRPPVISIMGHVDHWKTSLLDHIRKSKVAAGEAGGITQSIGAYQVELDTWSITFLDTPWHEAFTVMRARWAKSTDIAILVVAADEWVKPQTLESINHAKEAEIPVIVAINKMDKEGANPDFVKWQLAEAGLVAEDWGGEVPMVPVSALTGFWVDELLEIILLVAEMKELKANPDRNAVWTIIESHLDSSLWPVATVLINTWTIKAWDNIVCEDSYGKVKVLKNYLNQKVKLAKPGEPVLIVGLDKVVEWWDILQVVSSSEVAKEKAIEYKAVLEKQKKANNSSLELLMSKIKSGSLKQLKIILKADTNGSLEAIKGNLHKLSTPETEIVIIHTWVWAITEWDILMWQGSEAILVGFGVGVLPTAKAILENSGIEFIQSDIIYHITERIEKIITGMLDPKEVEIALWKAKIGGIFFTEKKFMIVGLTVPPESRIEANSEARIVRDKKLIWIWKIESLKQWTLEVKEVEWPVECWIKLVTSVKIEIWDELEVYKIEIQR